MAHIDFKVTSWDRLKIKDDQVEEAKALIESGAIANASDAMELLELDDGTEPICDTEAQMTLEENSGNATIELYGEETAKILATNEPND